MKTISSSRTQIVRLFAALALALSLLCLPVGGVRSAGDITVTNDRDDGEGSLRQAIADIDDGGTITFDHDYTIQLRSELVIGKNLTIDGGVNNIVLDGNGAVRVFEIMGGAKASLNALTVTGGKAENGAGIYSSGTLAIDNSTISDNHAGTDGGGIYNNGGSLTIINTTFSANSATYGGGIYYNGGSLTITNTTFYTNSANYGGGIHNEQGTLTITNNTFNGNSARMGGGISNHGGTLTISNSTFSGNNAEIAGGSMETDGSTLTITNSTFSGNSATGSGGNMNIALGTVTLRNTILANSLSGGNCSGTAIPTNGGNNIEDGTTCGWGSNLGSMSSSNPMLSSLGAYGGPTQTFALLPGSPAIDRAGTCAASPVNGVDQRGITRPSACDIGAFESGGFTLAIASPYNPYALVNTAFTLPLKVSVSPVRAGEPVDGGTVTFIPPASGASAILTGSPAVISGGLAQVTATANDIVGSYNVNGSTIGASAGVDFGLHNKYSCSNITVINSNDDGPGSLRQAIASLCAGGTITFAGDTTIHLASMLTIDKNLTIDGTGHVVSVSGDTNSDGSGDVPVFFVNAGATMNLDTLTVSKGASRFGGGIYSAGALNINNSTFTGNSAGDSGGGIANEGTMTITNSTFSGGSANFDGGGIMNHGTLSIANSTFYGNSAESGGGIDNEAGTLIITNSSFSGNSANEYGGGIHWWSGSITIRNTILANSLSGGNCSGTITNGGNNLEDGTTCGWGSASGSLSNTNPLLGSLADNGGPTQTFALLPGSPAIDKGNDAICMAAVGAPDYGAGGLDQRGVTRLHGSHCDIGAFELDKYRIYLPLVKR